MRVNEIIYGLAGQEVEIYFPECVRDCLGAPTAVTVACYRGEQSNDQEPEFTVACAVDDTDGTLDDDSGQSQTIRNKLLMDGSELVPGRMYLLDNGAGQREIVEPRSTGSASVTLLLDLQYDYAKDDSSLTGLRTSFVVPTAWVQDESNISLPKGYDFSLPSPDYLLPGTADFRSLDYRLIYSYTIGSTAYRLQAYARLVRKPFRSTLNYNDLIGRWGDMLSTEDRDTRGEKFRRMIVEAETQVRSDIIAEGYTPEQFSNSETIDRLVNHAFDYNMARFHGAPADRDREAFIIECKREYGDLFTKMITALKIQLDTSSQGASNPAPVHRIIFSR